LLRVVLSASVTSFIPCFFVLMSRLPPGSTLFPYTTLFRSGWLGKNDLAAGSLAGSLYQACMIFSLGLVSATIPMLATTLGKQRDDAQAVQEILRHGFLTAVLICIPFWILLWNADTLLLALGQDRKST